MRRRWIWFRRVEVRLGIGRFEIRRIEVRRIEVWRIEVGRIEVWLRWIEIWFGRIEVRLRWIQIWFGRIQVCVGRFEVGFRQRFALSRASSARPDGCPRLPTSWVRRATRH